MRGVPNKFATGSPVNANIIIDRGAPRYFKVLQFAFSQRLKLANTPSRSDSGATPSRHHGIFADARLASNETAGGCPGGRSEPGQGPPGQQHASGGALVEFVVDRRDEFRVFIRHGN